MRKNKSLSWILVVLWMIIIFVFSNQQGTVSSNLSQGITRFIYNLLNKLFTGNIDIDVFHYFIRKAAHFTIYFILGILVTRALIIDIKPSKVIPIALLFCVLYAGTDEFHQLFISGRSGQLTDVIIDSAGATVGIILYKLVKVHTLNGGLK